MKAPRICRPSSVRMGMFCRFGSLLLRRPVAATAWLKLVCTRPVSGLTSTGRASMYVPFSFIIPRQSRISLGSSWVSASSSRTSTAVDGARDVPVRLRTGRPIRSNSTSASCFGELMLNSPPASSWIRFIRRFSSRSTCRDWTASAAVSTRTPACSIAMSTGIRGSSRERYTSVNCSLSSMRAENRRELPREVGPLAREIEGRFHGDVAKRQRLDALAADVFFRQRLVGRVLERQLFERVGRPGRVDQVAGDHRVEVEPEPAAHRAWRERWRRT